MAVGIYVLAAAAVGAATSSPAPPATPASLLRGTAGCGRSPEPGPTAPAAGTGDVVQSLTVGTVIRSYRLAVPGRYRSTSPTPLILLFHGSGSDALQQSAYSGLPARGARAGFLVATPDAVGEQWQVSAPDARTADLTFVSSLITALSARYCVDRGRIYAAGSSLGSEFSALVACAVPHRIAAIGLVAAEFLPRPCSGPIPVMAFHGTADPLVPYANGGVGESIPGPTSRGRTEPGRLGRAGRVPAGSRPPAGGVDRPPPSLARVPGGRRGGPLQRPGGHTWPGSPISSRPPSSAQRPSRSTPPGSCSASSSGTEAGAESDPSTTRAAVRSAVRPGRRPPARPGQVVR